MYKLFHSVWVKPLSIKPFCFIALVASLTACDQPDTTTQGGAVEPTEGVPTTSEQINSYALGQNVGSSFVHADIDIDKQFFYSGFNDAVAGTESKLSEQEIQEAMSAVQNMVRENQAKKHEVELSANLELANAFLAKNSTLEGVVTLESGLQYKVLTEGNGEIPTADDTVEVNYEGRLTSGEVFDSSYERGESVSFPVRGVIAGWTEALQLMKTGSKWQLYIPPNLAYGERGAGPQIGPNSALVFDVELISIEKPEAAEEGAQGESAE